MEKKILFMAAVLLGAAGLALAQEGELHGTVGVEYSTKYIWRGFEVFGSKSAIHPFIDVDLMGTGFGINAIAHRANSSGYEELERWDYTLYYQGCWAEQDTYETQYRVGYTYFNYPDRSSHTRSSWDLQEFHAIARFPNVLGVTGLVPGYALIKGWPSNSGTAVGSNNANGGSYSGWAHVLMLDYGLPVALPMLDIPEQMLNLHFETVFNDKVDPRPNGGYRDSDWTHYLVGVSTDFTLADNLVFTPGIYYQQVMEDGLPNGLSDDQDLYWSSFTLTYKF
jgi:hypothetical protein